MMIIAAFAFLVSGCVSPSLRPPGPDLSQLQHARDAFLNGEYQVSEGLFNRIARHNSDEQVVASARYGLFCLAMVRAKSVDAFLENLESILHYYPGSDPMHKDNSLLMIAAIRHGYILLRTDRSKTAAQQTAAGKENDKLKSKNKQLEARVKQLEHQILTLETIDHEVQEKRKNQ